MNLPLEARRWQDDLKVEIQWFSNLPDAQEWIGDYYGNVIYTAADGVRNYMWIKT
jgi:hypothetical protein